MHPLFDSNILVFAGQGAIIIFGIMPLFNPAEGLHLWHVDKFDWLVWMTGECFSQMPGLDRPRLSA